MRARTTTARWLREPGTRRRRLAVTFAVFVAALCVRETRAATWPLVKDIRTNVVEVENADGGAMTVKATGGVTISADAVVFEGDAYAEYEDTFDTPSTRLYDIETRLQALLEELTASIDIMDGNLTTCTSGKQSLLAEVEALEAAWTSAGARFTPPTCTGANARNLIYVRDATLGHNVWSCVCKNDYTGTNCEIPPCDTSAFATLGSCAVANTLAVGAQCDVSCGSNSVQDTPLKCTLQGGVGVLNAPTCTECNLCTDCDGPGKNNFDYTNYTGANCLSPPCDLNATLAKYALREGGTCAADANQKIPVGATCDIECAANSVQDSQLTCTWNGTSSLFDGPSCVACTGNYTGANCVTAPCIVGSGASDGSCGAALAVGASCAQYCAETGKFITSASTCSASGSTISSPGPCRQMDFTVTGYASSFKLSTSTISSKVDGVQQFNITTAEYEGSLFTNNGDEKYYYSAIDLTVSKSGIYHVSWQHAVSPSGDYVMLIYRNSFNPDKPARNLAFGNDDAYINVNSNTYPEATDGNWYDGKNYYTGKYAPAAFVSLDEDVSYVLVFTSYFRYSTYPSFEVPAQVSLTCGMLDFDGPDTAYAYHDDQELVDNLALTRGYCSVRAWAP